MDGATKVYFCERCAHLQTTEIQDISAYYDKQYNILVSSEDEDQIYKFEGDKRIFRYDFQADTVLAKLDIPREAKVLEYGAAKGATLRRMLRARTDLHGCVFDVSDRYVDFWNEFLEPSAQATYELPTAWTGSFDYVVSFYVLEHVTALNALMESVWSLLRDGGTFYFIVPDTYANIADFVVADHCNHFSDLSLDRLCRQSGFQVVDVDSTTHDSAFIVTARKSEGSEVTGDSGSVEALRARAVEIADYWTRISGEINGFEREVSNSRAAIYGAGFYGSYIFTSLSDSARVECFIDQNPHLQGKQLFGRPILAPDELPGGVETMYVGLNPRHARETFGAVAALQGRGLKLLFL
jgi:SAM-dependent methyltransferase